MVDQDQTDPSEQFRAFTGTKKTSGDGSKKLPDSTGTDTEKAAHPQPVSKTQKDK